MGIGASVEGLQALRALFQAMPAHSGLGFAIVQQNHLDGQSLLAALQAETMPMPVVEITDGLAVAPNRIHVAPAQGEVHVAGGIFRLVPPPAPPDATAIDSFFQTLAADQQSRAVGVLLSGIGTDGTLGLEAISAAGGMCMVQSPDAAADGSPPRSAIATNIADHVLPPEQLSMELLAYTEYLAYTSTTEHRQRLAEQIEHAIPTIAGMLAQHVGHDFQHYKSRMLVRRIRRRMRVLKVQSVGGYLDRIRGSRDEATALFRELLIGVTAFFRDPASFEALAQVVIPALLERRPPDSQVRIWVPGCATGEEAYSLAILVREHMDRLAHPPEVKIFATDIDERALQIAQRGAYPAGIAENVSPARLLRFFVKRGKRYHVGKEIRDLCLFSRHNLIGHPPLSRQDLISCRNLLIYLGPHLQKKLIPLFHYALRRSGYLFLGPSESITSHAELFRPVSVKHRIAQRRPTAVRSSTLMAHPPSYHDSARPPVLPGESEPDIPQVMQRIILDELSPKSAVVNEDGQIVCASGDMSKYLAVKGGTFQNSIIELARTGLRVGLRAALREAITTRRRATNERLSVDTGDGVQRVMVTVQPMPRLGEEAELLLVAFQDLGAPVFRQEVREQAVREDTDALIEHLERELRSTHEDLENTIQDLEVANEELKSSNEELLSMNEELQSANEELESSKEELQAGSEALSQANSDLENLLRSTGIGVIFLDDEHAIRRFTPAAARIYNLLPGDIGRPLEHLTHRAIEMPPLPVARALRCRGEPIAHTIQTADRHWYMRHVLPYRTHAGRHEGMVVIFADITELKQNEQALREAQDRLRHAVSAADVGTWRIELATGVDTRDASLNRILGLPARETSQPVEAFYKRVHPEDRARCEEQYRQAVATCGVYDLENRIVRPDGEIRWVRDRGRVSTDAAGKPQYITGALFDITERKAAEAEVTTWKNRYEAAVWASGQLLYDWDPATGEVVYGGNTEGILGYSAAALGGGGLERWLALVHADDRAAFREALERARAEGKPFHLEYRLTRKDGTLIHCEHRGHFIHDASGALDRMLGFVVDVTARKCAEEVLRDTDRQKDRFLAMLGHELRNPLAAIRSASELLGINGSDDTKLLRIQGVLDRQSAHMVRLIDELLDVSRIARGKLTLQQEALDLVQVLREVVQDRALQIQRRELVLQTEIDPQPLWIEGDRVRLAQVFDNLLGNALKFTEPPGMIRIVARRDSRMALVCVRDTGVGIPTEMLQSIFEPFQQAPQDMARTEGGLGLGLALVKGIVELHGGTSEARNASAGTGAEILVRLPLTDARPRAVSREESGALEAVTILVVEDNEDSAALLREALESRGHRTRLARTGPEAVTLARRMRPDVILCDLGLPGMSGHEVARTLRGDSALAGASMIALTGYGQEEDRQRSHEAGFDAHVTKPVDVAAIEGLIARLRKQT